MRKFSGRTAALCAFFVVALAIAGCGSGVPGNSVADVAGNPITTQAFNHWLFVAAKSQAAQSGTSTVIVPNDPPQFNGCIAQVRREIPSYKKVPIKQIRAACKQDFTTLSGQVMGYLILGYWYQLEAVRDHVKFTNAQFQKAFETAKSQFPSNSQFAAFLSQNGETLQDAKFQIRISTIARKLVSKETKTISSSAIAQYYNSHLSAFGTQQARDLRIVLTKTLAQANAAKRALASGQSWNKIARKDSIDPTSKATGGLLADQTKGQLDMALGNAAFSAPLNKLLGPVKGQFGYYVFEVTKVIPATQRTLAQASPAIRQTLVGEQQNKAQSALAQLLRKHWLGQTSCRAGYVTTAECRGYKAPKTPTTPGR